MPTTITKRLEIDAGHRLAKHESKCRNYHGHRFAFEITCRSKMGSLDEVGRIVDFSVVKQLVGGWLDEHWDHAMLLEQSDPLLSAMSEVGTKVYVVPCSPTSENLAKLVFYVADGLLADHGVQVLRVTCYETPTSKAEYAG